MWQSLCQQVSLHSHGIAGAATTALIVEAFVFVEVFVFVEAFVFVQLTSAWEGHHQAVHVPESRSVPFIRNPDPHQLLKAPLKG